MPGLPGIEVTAKGRVRSWRRGYPRVLGQFTHGGGETKYVKICMDGKQLTRSVGVLVRLAWPVCDERLRELREMVERVEKLYWDGYEGPAQG